VLLHPHSVCSILVTCAGHLVLVYVPVYPVSQHILSARRAHRPPSSSRELLLLAVRTVLLLARGSSSRPLEMERSSCNAAPSGWTSTEDGTPALVPRLSSSVYTRLYNGYILACPAGPRTKPREAVYTTAPAPCTAARRRSVWSRARQRGLSVTPLAEASAAARGPSQGRRGRQVLQSLRCSLRAEPARGPACGVWRASLRSEPPVAHE
jgi:hypothetical protein